MFAAIFSQSLTSKERKKAMMPAQRAGRVRAGEKINQLKRPGQTMLATGLTEYLKAGNPGWDRTAKRIPTHFHTESH